MSSLENVLLAVVRLSSTDSLRRAASGASRRVEASQFMPGSPCCRVASGAFASYLLLELRCSGVRLCLQVLQLICSFWAASVSEIWASTHAAQRGVHNRIQVAGVYIYVSVKLQRLLRCAVFFYPYLHKAELRE